jgi:hypothetical protein
MMPYKLFIPFLVFLIFFEKSFAGDFEGNLMMVKETFYDTTFYQLTVQKNLIRIDQKNSQNVIVQSIIVDTKNDKIIALSPNHKLFTEIQVKFSNQGGKNDLSIIPTQSFKIINGYKCYLWRVRNENLNSEISYWVYNSEFGFFQKAIRLLNSTEDYSNIFSSFPEIEKGTGLPIMTIERTLLREEKARITITSINNRKVNSDLFIVPSDYKCLRY